MMKHFKRNWVAKILSLLMAIVMWFFIMRDQNPVMDVSYTVPVQIQNLASNYIVEDAPEVVRVTLSGPRDTIISMREDHLKAYIDASGVGVGQNNVTIQFTPPAGMTVTNLRPENITLQVDEYAEKTLPVEIVPVGKWPDDIALKSVTIIPKEVTVSGRKQQVMAAARVIMKVNTEGRTENFSTVEDLETWDANGNILNVHTTPAIGQAQYELNFLRKEKALPVTVATVGDVPEGYEIKSITVTPTQLTISGRAEVVDSVTDIRTEDIDVSNATTTITGSYNIVFPDGITSRTTTVQVKIEIARKA